MVIGKPIEIVKVENPTIEEVNRVFEIYQNALENLFYEHKNKYLQDKTTVLQFR